MKINEIKYSDIYDWELNLLDHNQKEEISFWLKRTKDCDSRILELACGSGRITIPLLEKNHKITAVDISKDMLSLLKKKINPNDDIEIIQSDMKSFSLDENYWMVIITYGSFQLLTTEEEQIICLKNIANHMNENGILIIDTHNKICEDPQSISNILLYTEYNKDLRLNISMITSYQTDLINKTRCWNDKYLIKNTVMNKDIVLDNTISLKEIPIDEMEKLCDIAGLKIIKLFGDFNETDYNSNSDKIIYMMKKISR